MLINQVFVLLLMLVITLVLCQRNSQSAELLSLKNPEPKCERPENNKNFLAFDLSKLRLKELRKSFVSSNDAICVNLEYNKLSYIEDGFLDNLPKLTYLNLAENAVQCNQLNFDNHSALEILVLDGACSIHDFTNFCIKLNTGMSLPKLKKLYLRKNNINMVIFDYKTRLMDIWPNLTHLFLSENRLNSIKFIEYMPPTLTHLYLNDNNITEFQSTSLSNLRVLVMDGNKIHTLCEYCGHVRAMTLSSAINLKEFSISRAELRVIEMNSFNKLTNLKYLDLSYNKLKTIPYYTFWSLKNLKYLLLDYNQLKVIPNLFGLDSLELLSLAGNEIRFVGRMIFDNLSQLKKLNLSNNDLELILPTSFEGLESMEELDLSGNKLKKLPDYWIPSKTSLRRLYLNNNLFTNVQSLSLLNAPKLELLDVNGNPGDLICSSLIEMLPKNASINFG